MRASDDGDLLPEHRMSVNHIIDMLTENTEVMKFVCQLNTANAELVFHGKITDQQRSKSLPYSISDNSHIPSNSKPY